MSATTCQRAEERERSGPTEVAGVCNGGVAHDDALDVGMGSVNRVYFAVRRAEGIVFRRSAACQQRTEREQTGDERKAV